MALIKLGNDILFNSLTKNKKWISPIEEVGFGKKVLETSLVGAGKFGEKFVYWPDISKSIQYGKIHLSEKLSRSITWDAPDDSIENGTYEKYISDVCSEIYKTMLSKESFVFNCIGSSGSGKTYLIRKLIQEFTNENYYDKLYRFLCDKKNQFTKDINFLDLFKDCKLVVYMAEHKLSEENIESIEIRKHFLSHKYNIKTSMDNIIKVVTDEKAQLFGDINLDNEKIRYAVNRYITDILNDGNSNHLPRLYVLEHDENLYSSRSILYTVFSFILSSDQSIEVMFIDNMGFENVSVNLQLKKYPGIKDIQMNFVENLINPNNIFDSFYNILELRNPVDFDDFRIDNDMINDAYKNLYVLRSAEGMFGYKMSLGFFSMFNGDGLVKVETDIKCFDIINKIIHNPNYEVLNVLQLNESTDAKYKRRDFLLYLSFFNRIPLELPLFYL